MNIVEWMNKGGFFIWPLVLCSLVGLAAILDRAYVFLRESSNFQSFFEQLKEKLLSLGPDSRQLRNELGESRGTWSQLTLVYLQYLASPKEVRNKALEREGRVLLSLLNLRMKLLSSIAHVAPLLGLLGTVAGLVSAFMTIEGQAGAVNPSDLAGGIWEALLTTVVGLCIAIPAYLHISIFNPS